jgi:hypothetical protein
MKNYLVLFASSLALAGCSVSADTPSLADFSLPQGSPQAPSSGVTSTFVTECASASGLSFRLQLNMKDQTPELTQTTYSDNGSCIGHPDDSNVQSSVVTKGVSAKVSADGLTATISGADGTNYSAKKVDTISFYDGAGIFAQYRGAAVSGGSVKTASLFAQIVGHSPYSGNYPYIWTYENGAETNPRSNPWVSSGAYSSVDYIKTMSTCATPVSITVAAGRFSTCLVTHGAEKIWYGNVPLYGIVKYERPEGTVATEFYLNSLVSQLGLPSTAALSMELVSVGY